MLKKHGAPLGDAQMMPAVDRLTSAASEQELIAALRACVDDLVPGCQCAIATRVSVHGADHLTALAHRALIEGTSVRETDAVALTGGQRGYPAIVVAMAPAPDAGTASRIGHWVNLAARLLVGVRALEQTHHVPAQPTPPDAPVLQQLDALREDARMRDQRVILALVDQAVCPLLSPDQLPVQRRRLIRQLRRILRPEDRVWEYRDRVLVAQVLPTSDISLLDTRVRQAIRATHAEEGVARRLVDVWVTGDRKDALQAAEEGLLRLAGMREAGRRCLAGDRQALDVLDDKRQWAVMIDNHRSTIGANSEALRMFPEVPVDAPPHPTDFSFFRPDGTQLREDGLPGRTVLRTGVSTQDQVVGVRFPGGGMHWGLVAVSGVDDGRGSVAGFVVTVALLRSPRSTPNRLRDAMDLHRQPMVLMEPVGHAGEIEDFRVTGLNARALTMLRAREEDVLGALETDIYPFDTRLGLVLDYARVIATGESTKRPITLPAGPLAGSYDVSALPCEGSVLVVAHSRGEGTRASDTSRFWDSLTGLNNRQGLLEELRDLGQAASYPVTLVLLDIDDFTAVNDMLGRVSSDRFLMEVGRILSNVADPQDLVARIGNDEFAVLTTAIASPEQAQAFADQVRRAVKAGVWVNREHFTAASSVGVAWTTALDEMVELLSVADAAMAESKAAGGDTVTMGHRERRTPAMRAVAMESQLREAIAEQQFVLHYQPVVDLTNGRVTGAEALIRWQHPERGVVLPGDFIPVAERRHLITKIGEWAVQEAFAQLAHWRDVLGFTPKLALNTSIGQLIRPGFARTILSCAAHEGIDPGVIQLEITESQLLHAEDTTLANLQACRDAGCELAIDDFGTGHAGFDYLRHIPARVLKIDKTFIDGLSRDTTDGAIVAGVIALGHGLGMSVVAEGVETEQQAGALRELGCDAGQGWLWHRALPADDLEAVLRAGDVTG